MARTSSSRRSNAFPGLAALLALLVLGVAAFGVTGCSNDNPREDGGTITVDIRGIKQSLGNGFTTSTTGPGDSAATTDVKSLIIGAVVITFTDTPLDETTQIDSDVEDKLASDVINSINFFSIVDLPTSDDFVEFKVPPPGSDHWQVAAIGTRKQIAVFEDLDDANVAIYYGFTPQFFNTSGSTGPDVDIVMNRACFIDQPPAGCAALGDNGNITITPTVKILDYLDNGSTMAGMAATIGTGLNVTNTTQAGTAMTNLNAAFNPVAGHTYTVVMTHPDAPGQAGCSTLTRTTYNLTTDADCTGISTARY